MTRDELQEDLVDLGAASIETKGGQMGFDDYEGTKWYHNLGLADD